MAGASHISWTITMGGFSFTADESGQKRPHIRGMESAQRGLLLISTPHNQNHVLPCNTSADPQRPAEVSLTATRAPAGFCTAWPWHVVTAAGNRSHSHAARADHQIWTASIFIAFAARAAPNGGSARILPDCTRHSASRCWLASLPGRLSPRCRLVPVLGIHGRLPPGSCRGSDRQQACHGPEPLPSPCPRARRLGRHAGRLAGMRQWRVRIYRS